jgi:uncharacterized membrane protein YeaQ/YmgE (transglycosylase-associated protein family)
MTKIGRRRLAAFATTGRVGEMDSIPWLSDLEELSGFDLGFFVLVVIIATLAAGFFADAMTQRSGFGPIPNGILALIGVCGGIYLRYRLFATYRADDAIVTITMAIAGEFVFLFVLILAKSRLF